LTPTSGSIFQVEHVARVSPPMVQLPLFVSGGLRNGENIDWHNTCSLLSCFAHFFFILALACVAGQGRGESVRQKETNSIPSVGAAVRIRVGGGEFCRLGRWSLTVDDSDEFGYDGDRWSFSIC